MAPVRLAAVVIDAADPIRQAAFWARALRWSHPPVVTATGASISPGDVTPFTIQFIARPEVKSVQNRIHFDVTTSSADDQRDTVEELLSLGAQHIDIGQRADEGHVVLADPEGNELCIIEPGNSFLSSCPRLGAVNCDGTHALGVFWSAALGWPLVWDQDEETAIQPPDGAGPKLTWSGPPLMPRPPRERLHLHVDVTPGIDLDAAIARLRSLGATDRSPSADPCAGTVALVDVDGNPFCLLDQFPRP